MTSSELLAGKVKAKKGAPQMLPFPPPGQLNWTTMAFHPKETLRDESVKLGPEYNKAHLCVCCLNAGPADDREGYRKHEQQFGCTSKINYLADHPSLLVAARLRALQALEDEGHVPTWQSL